MVNGFGILQFVIVGVLGVVKAMGTKHFLTSNENQFLIRWDSQDLVWRHELSSSKGVGFAVAWRVISDPHGIEFTHGSFNFHTGYTDSIAEVFCCQHVRTAQEDGGITCTEDLLPLIVRISVLHLSDILEENGDGYASASDGTAFLLEVRDTPGAIRELIQDEFYFCG